MLIKTRTPVHAFRVNNTVIIHFIISSAPRKGESVRMSLCECDLTAGQVRRYKKAYNEQTEIFYWVFHTNAASGKGILAVVCTKSRLIATPGRRDCTSPFCTFVSTCVRACLCVRRKRGAVGVRAVSCWWEWDKNLFPLPKAHCIVWGFCVLS